MRETYYCNQPWLGVIPTNWVLRRGKFVFKQRNEKGNQINLELLSPTQKFGVIPQSKYEELTGMSPVKLRVDTDLSQLKTIHKGDYCISLRSFQGGFEYSEYEGVVSPAYQVFYPIVCVCSSYYKYLFKMQSFIDKMNSYTLTLRDGKTIAFSDFANTLIPIPPISEQSAIADSLDSNLKKVETLINNQEQQIEKLKAYKQSLITEAVTKGLNPDAPMKPSGVEWIGKIPSHWAITRAKFLADRIDKGNGITRDDVIADGEIQCVRYGEIYTKYNGSFSKCYSRTNLDRVSKPQFISCGDIMFSGTGELIEEIGKNVVYIGDEPCIAGGDIIVFKHQQEPRFLNYALNSEYSQKQKSFGKMKLKVVHISAFAIGNIVIAYPDYGEQKQIADYLDKKCSAIDRLIEIKQQKIDKLNDYKKSLIYEYVTGKKEA